MASEDEANRARRAHAPRLTKLGAHAVGVEPGRQHGKHGWVVVAHVPPGKNIELPAALSAYRDRKADVPLVVRRSQPFQLE
jgi:hypothetical protein